MIPNYQEFMRPFLRVVYGAHGQEVKLRDVIETLAEQFELTDEEREERLPSGRQTVLDNRVGWARTYLAKAQLITIPRRGFSQITARGKQAIEDRAEINNAYLRQFDEFMGFINASKNAEEIAQSADDTKSDITPDEVLRNAYKQLNDALAQELLERTRNVSPAFFEEMLIKLLLAMGYGGSDDKMGHTLGKTGDNGVDGVINQDPLGVDQIYIQAKRYAQENWVGSPAIRDFCGALSQKKANKGIFITTSDFTASAHQACAEMGTKIVLINGRQLSRLMVDYGIGCRNEQVLTVREIDEGFFES